MEIELHCGGSFDLSNTEKFKNKIHYLRKMQNYS